MTRRGWFNRLFKPRGHKRHRVRKGAFIILGPAAEARRVARIFDISLSGLAIVYRGSPEKLEDSGVLSLFSGETLYADGIAFETIHDLPVRLAALPGQENIRRRGVAFRSLGVLDKQQIGEFIRNASSR